MLAARTPGMRCRPGGCAGDGAALPSGDRHRARLAPKIIEYLAQAKECAGRRTVTAKEGERKRPLTCGYVYVGLGDSNS